MSVIFNKLSRFVIDFLPRNKHIKKRDITLLIKVHNSKSYGFSSSHVWMWKLDHKEGWVPENWCFWTVVLEKTLESPLDCKEIKPSRRSILKEISPEYSLEGLMLKSSVLWPPDVKSQLIRNDPDAGKDWRQEEKGTTEDKMVGWHHWLNGYELEQVLGDDEEQVSLVLCSPWGHKKLDTT